MYTKKLIWTPNCIDWKEFGIKCMQYISYWADDCCTAEEFCDNTYNVEETEFLESQQEELGKNFYDITTAQEWEKIEKKCKEVYNSILNDKKKELVEECGFNFN